MKKPNSYQSLRLVAQELNTALSKSVELFIYSYDQCRTIDMQDGLTAQQLIAFEALTARFARLSDLLIQKAFRMIDQLELEETGSILDRLNRAEKRRLIDDADQMRSIRFLRNRIAHEYVSDALHHIFTQVLHLAPVLKETADRTTAYLAKHTLT